MLKEGIRHFQAAEPKRILDYLHEREEELAEKKQRILEVLPQLELKQKLGRTKRQAEIYEGKRGIMNLYQGILDDLRKGEEYYVLGAGYGFKDSLGLRGFFQKYHAMRAKRGIKVNMLANADVQKLLVPATQLCSEIRFLPEELITEMMIVFYKDKSFIVLCSQEPASFLIYNPEMVQSFRKYFDLLWKNAKP